MTDTSLDLNEITVRYYLEGEAARMPDRRVLRSEADFATADLYRRYGCRYPVKSRVRGTRPTDECCGAKRERRLGGGSENWKPLTRSINHLGALLIASCGLGQSD